MLSFHVAIRLLFGIIFAIFLGTVSMIFAYSLPMDSMQKHATDSVSLYNHEEDYYAWAAGSRHSNLDNFTDAIMIMNAVHPLEQSNVYSAMMNFRWGSTDGFLTQTQTLVKALTHENDGLTDVSYPRYWHGYLLWLKPLLAMTELGHIRMLNAYGVFTLFVFVILMMQKKLNMAYVIAFAFAIMTMNIVTISMSFQYSSVYYITMLSILFMLSQNDTLYYRNLYPYFFCAIGIAVAFFDFLTYPVVSVGIPLMMWYLLNCEKKMQDIKKCMWFMLTLLFVWGIGYAGMWGGKWIISWALTGHNTLYEAIHQIGYYTMPTDEVMIAKDVHFAPLSAIWRNISHMGQGPIRCYFFGAVIYLLYILLWKKKRIQISLTGILPYGLIASLPFLWYMMGSGHSYRHAFFTYRALSVTIFSVLCFVITYLKNTKTIEKDINIATFQLRDGHD